MIITTTLGDMDDSLLEKTEGTLDNDNENTTWVEYRLKGDPPPEVRDGVCQSCLKGECKHIHRSAGINLKKGVFGDGAVGGIGN